MNKQWVGLEGRQFLVEEVPWGVVREQVERLPAARQAGRPQEAPVVGAVALWLPPAPAGRAAAAEAAPMQLAAVSPAGPGFVVDYVVLNTTQNHYTFRGDMTYDVSAQVTLNGTTTFEGGAVIKFRRTHAGLSLNGPWVCRTGPYRSVIFTARDDDSVGTRIAGSTGTPTGYYGNGVTLTKAGTLTNARFAFLPTALSYAPWGVPSNSNVLHLAHLQFIRCRTPLYVTDTRCFICGATVNLDNALIAQCDTFLEGEEVAVHARHVTVDQCTTLARREGGNCTLALTNSILSAVASLSSGGASVSGAHNAFHNTPSFGEDPIPLMANPFQSVGAGHYYLAAAVEPMLRNRGTPNLPGALLAALRQQTTRPPLVLANHITEDTVLGPQAPGDLCAPDLGYHYEPLDYVVSGRALSARLTLTNGVVLGTYGAANTRGLFVGFGGHLISEGSSVALNRIVRYNTVQEQSASPWSSSTAGIGIELANSSAQAQFRFTAWSLLGGNGIHFARGNGAAGFRDCQLAGGQFRWLEGLDLSFEGNLGLTNCLWERVQADLQAEDGGQVFAYNNLFRGGSWFWNNETENEWIVQDNLFDAVSLSRGSGTLTHGWNGYLGTAQLAGGSGGDVDITPPGDYQEGPLGNFYYPTSGDKLHRLVDAGSRSAAAAGLACATTRVDEQPDEGMVDIGFHYPIRGNCLPLGSRGFMLNLELTPGGHLRIKPTAQTTPLPFVNVAGSGRGTVTRIEVPSPWNPSLTTSRIVGEYYTSPGGNGDPSRTTVDRYGNVWVGNRAVGADGLGSVTKIGVVIGGTRCNADGSPNPNGQYLKPPFIYNTCVDRDGDGLIRTSAGLAANGSTDWVLPWAVGQAPEDEAILHYVRTTPTLVRSLAVDRDNNVWVGSRNDGWQELIDGTTGAPITGQKFLFGKGGYGAVIDPLGALWSPGYWEGDGLLWRPPGNGVNVLPGTTGGVLPGTLPPGGTKLAYGIGIDPTTADVWLTDYNFGGLWHFKQNGCSLRVPFAPSQNENGAGSKGIVVDGEGNIWVAHAYDWSGGGGEKVYRLRNSGEYRGAVVLNHPTSSGVVGKAPHGVSIDAQGQVWAICFQPAEDGKYYAMRIDPTQGVDSGTGNTVGQVVEAVDLGTFPAGQGPYNYSDMSGFVTLAATQPAGFWDFVQDSGADYTRWSTVTVDAELNSGEVIIEVRAADRVTELPSWPFRRLNGSSGVLCLAGLGIKGRYLEVRVTLLRDFGAAQGPVLKTLCLARGTPGTDLQITQHPKSMIVERGEAAQFSVTATGSGLSYQWFKDGTPVGTGATLSINNAQYANAGKYQVRVTDASGAFLDSAEARLHVVSAPPPDTRPYVQVDNDRPVLGQTVGFTATMDVSPSPGPVYYQWRKNGVPIAGASGVCTTSDQQNYTAEYSISSVACQDSGEYSVVFTNAFWKVASPSDESSRVIVTVVDQYYNPVPTVMVTPSSVQITDRHNPPTLTATACFTPLCAQWYRTDSLGVYFKEPIPGANAMQYTFPNPVPCEMLSMWNYFAVEVFDAGRFLHASRRVQVYGDCEP